MSVCSKKGTLDYTINYKKMIKAISTTTFVGLSVILDGLLMLL